MQSLSWYRNRLLSMQPGEIAWRVSNLLRDRLDRAMLARRQKTLARLDATALSETSSKDHTAHLSPLINATDAWLTPEGDERNSLMADADAILRHQIRLLGRRRIDVGTPIRWNYEHNKNAPTPTSYAGDIDYRDYAETGDCKWVWELNRHHHLVVLGRAYRLTGNDAYAREVIEQIRSWIDACEFGTGMNWRSPLELSIRLINWAYALALIEPANVLDGDTRRCIESSIYQHLWEVSRKYSRYSSANNHLIGEAAGVYVAACRFPHLPNAATWRDEARRILIDEIQNQVDADGVHRELATGYHLFVLQFFTIARIAGERSGDAFPVEFDRQLSAMGEFLETLSAAGPIPLFGDCDDGYVLDLGGERGDPHLWVRMARSIAPSDNANISNASTERAGTLASHRFEAAGIYLLQGGTAGTSNAISATVDVGPLGFKSIAAHGHADALSITLRAFGVEFLIDPGTYDYFTHPDWRDYFRSTRAHNTIEIDALDQSQMLGKFLWGSRANATCVEWTTNANGARLVAEHDGYARLADGVIHRRTVALDAFARRLDIEDELRANASHNGVMHFHFAPECRVEQVRERTIRASRREGAIELTLPETTTITICRGETAPILGWCSRAYHEKEPITTIRAAFAMHATRRLATRVQVCTT